MYLGIYCFKIFITNTRNLICPKYIGTNYNIRIYNSYWKSFDNRVGIKEIINLTLKYVLTFSMDSNVTLEAHIHLSLTHPSVRLFIISYLIVSSSIHVLVSVIVTAGHHGHK